eukprot:gene33221-38567_t
MRIRIVGLCALLLIQSGQAFAGVARLSDWRRIGYWRFITKIDGDQKIHLDQTLCVDMRAGKPVARNRNQTCQTFDVKATQSSLKIDATCSAPNVNFRLKLSVGVANNPNFREEVFSRFIGKDNLEHSRHSVKTAQFLGDCPAGSAP